MTGIETAGAAVPQLSPAPIAVAEPPTVAAAKMASFAPVPIAQDAAIEREALMIAEPRQDKQASLYVLVEVVCAERQEH